MKKQIIGVVLLLGILLGLCACGIERPEMGFSNTDQINTTSGSKETSGTKPTSSKPSSTEQANTEPGGTEQANTKPGSVEQSNSGYGSFEECLDAYVKHETSLVSKEDYCRLYYDGFLEWITMPAEGYDNDIDSRYAKYAAQWEVFAKRGDYEVTYEIDSKLSFRDSWDASKFEEYLSGITGVNRSWLENTYGVELEKLDGYVVELSIIFKFSQDEYTNHSGPLAFYRARNNRWYPLGWGIADWRMDEYS